MKKRLSSERSPVSLTRRLKSGTCSHTEKEMADVCTRPMNGYFHCGSFPSEWNGSLSALKNQFDRTVALLISITTSPSVIYACGRRNLPSRGGHQSADRLTAVAHQRAFNAIKILIHLKRGLIFYANVKLPQESAHLNCETSDSHIFQIVAFKGKKRQLVSGLSGVCLFYYVYIKGNGLEPFSVGLFGP